MFTKKITTNNNSLNASEINYPIDEINPNSEIQGTYERMNRVDSEPLRTPSEQN
jgi:hypothetical protein